MRNAARACLLATLLACLAAAGDPKPLTEEECLAFAKSFETALKSGDLDAAVECVDWNALLDRVTAGADQEDEFVKGFRGGMRRAQRQPGALIPTVIEAVRQGGGYTLLRIRERDGRKRPLFRLIGEGVNYHECELVRSRDGRVRIVDIYVYLSAEDASSMMRRVFLPLAADASAGFLQRLVGTESDYTKHISEIQSISTHTREGRPAEALRVYRKLPASLRSEKNLLIMRLMAAQAVGEEEYEAAFKDLRARYPDDPCVDIFAIDACINGRRYDEAIASIDRLEKSVGGDPYTDLLRANIQYMKGDRTASARFAKKAIEAEPTLLPPYWTLVQISLDEKKFDETARLLVQIEQSFALTMGDLTEIDDYSEFVKSAEYRKWLERGK